MRLTARAPTPRRPDPRPSAGLERALSLGAQKGGQAVLGVSDFVWPSILEGFPKRFVPRLGPARRREDFRCSPPWKCLNESFNLERLEFGLSAVAGYQSALRHR